MRLIDADAMNKYLHDEYHGAISDSELKVYRIIGIVNDAPTVDAVAVVRGEWVWERYTGMWPAGNPRPEQKCSLCGSWAYQASAWCPHCGAKMQEADE